MPVRITALIALAAAVAVCSLTACEVNNPAAPVVVQPQAPPPPATVVQPQVPKANLSRRSGDAIIELHLWNEQLPMIPRKGANIACGALVDKRVRRSLTLLAAHLVAYPDVVALHGEAAFGCQWVTDPRTRARTARPLARHAAGRVLVQRGDPGVSDPRHPASRVQFAVR